MKLTYYEAYILWSLDMVEKLWSLDIMKPTYILCCLLTYYAAYLHIMLPTYIIFDMIGVEIQDFQELKPKPETSEQDLDVGRG